MSPLAIQSDRFAAGRAKEDRGDPAVVQEARLLIIMPVLDDWESFNLLIRSVSETFQSSGVAIRVMVVDDGSVESIEKIAPWGSATTPIESIEVVRLVCNLGHQRAIAIGLALSTKETWPTHIGVMDSDGEDSAEDLQTLLQRVRDTGLVTVASRARRSEGHGFRLGYLIYRSVFRILTGLTINFGNFSVFPASSVHQLAHVPDLWNNFPGALLRSRLRFARHPTTRATRLAGASRMNYASLVVHGLGAISVHYDVLLSRLLILAASTLTIAGAISAVVVWIKLFTVAATPGWATVVVLGALTISFQTILSIGLSALLLLSARNQSNIIPALDSLRFVRSRSKIALQDGAVRHRV